MVPAAFFGAVAILYYLCFLTLGVMLFLFWLRRGRGSRANRQLRSAFLILALSMFAWLATLFLEVRLKLPLAQLWVGRFNFAVGALVVYYAFRFVQHVPLSGSLAPPPLPCWLLAETAIVAGITLLTPMVDAEEIATQDRAITVFGPLSVIYLIHIAGYLIFTVSMAHRQRSLASSQVVRAQFTLVLLGLLTTGSVAVLTNVLLPYCFNDFRYCDVGALSTLVFLIAVGYATIEKGLFDLKFVIRETIVYGMMLAMVLGVYSSALFVASQFVAGNSDKITQFVVLVIAFSFDPIRRYLEKKTDRLLFGRDDGREDRADGGGNRRGGTRQVLAMLFPWRG